MQKKGGVAPEMLGDGALSPTEGPLMGAPNVACQL